MLARFPPTLIVVGDMDPLLDDATTFHRRLAAAGAPSELRLLQGFCRSALKRDASEAPLTERRAPRPAPARRSHGWMNMSAVVPDCRREVEAIAAWLATAGTGAGPGAAPAPARQ
eukprot:tig00020675_g12657.t1